MREKGEKTVSVIVPVYRAQDYLERCVGSIVGQSYERLEVILVDDGSPDDCPRMCDAWEKRDSRVRVLHKKNGGLMSAWMAGVEAAAGEYLLFVDSDDWIDACMVEKLMAEAKGTPGEVICCSFVIERPGFRAQKVFHELQPGIYAGKELDRVKSRLLGNERRTVSMSRCMKLFSRGLITDNLHLCNPEIRMGEDVNIVLPALCDCRRLVILKEAAYYHYFYNPASMVHKYDEGMADGIRKLLQAVRDVFEEKRTPDWEEQWERESVYLFMLAVKNELRGGKSGYAERIRVICEEQLCGEKMGRYGIRPQDKANRILSWVMRRPDGFRCFAGKQVFELYDRWMQACGKG